MTAPDSVSVTVACAGCAATRLRHQQDRQLIEHLQQQLDAERKHGADLERRLLRHLPTWEKR